jgi:hypothetical protein
MVAFYRAGTKTLVLVGFADHNGGGASLSNTFYFECVSDVAAILLPFFVAPTKASPYKILFLLNGICKGHYY